MKIEKTNHNSDKTKSNKQIQILKKHFPQCFDKNKHFIPHKMQEQLAKNGINISKESYSLNWLGKSYAKFLSKESPLSLLKADTQHNKTTAHKNSENLLIKGDNLEVLKHLRYAYQEQIKVIYIDPPYNTGANAFTYQDDRKFTPEQLANLAGIDKNEAQRILSLTKASANSHSAWLTFIYPRLYIARELLKNDGVIFISIDDKEQAQLKLLCDEIFGEDNFIAKFSWVKTATPPSLSKTLRKKVEYILCYKKQTIHALFGHLVKGGDAPLLNKSNKISTLTMPHTHCYFKTFFGKVQAGKYKGLELLTDINIKNNKANCDFKIRGPFKWSQSFLNKEIKKRTSFVVKSNNFSIRYLRVGDRQVRPANILNKHNGAVGTNEDAGKEIKLLHLDGLFSNPKPTSLIKYLINMLCHNNDTILDFFAGSGTTADAVMQLNAQDGGKRKCISIQLAEPINKNKNKNTYDFIKNILKQNKPSIFDITKERILRAAKKIQTEQAPKKDLFIKKLDLGFKVFETLTGFNDIDELKSQNKKLKIHDDTCLSKDHLQTLLTTWMLSDGIKLNLQVKTIILDKYTGYYADKKLYLMDKEFSQKDLKVLLKKLNNDTWFKPDKLILFAYNFESKQQKQIYDALRTYNNKNKLTLKMLARD